MTTPIRRRLMPVCTHEKCLCRHSYGTQCSHEKKHGAAIIYCTLPIGHDGDHYNCANVAWKNEALACAERGEK